jgi:hypothetical protein
MHQIPSALNQWVGLFFLVVVFPMWLWGMGTFVYFWLNVAPSGLQHWADAEGYQIIQRNNPGFRDWRFMASNSGPDRIYGRVYRVAVSNKAGESRGGLAVVGGPGWYRLTIRRCPVEVRWDGDEPLTPTAFHPQKKHLLWDRELG